MKGIPSAWLLLTTLILVLSACGPAASGVDEQPAVHTPTEGTITNIPTLPTNTAEPTRTPRLTSAPEPTGAPQLSFVAASYKDETAGFKLDYPADWTLQPKSTIGPRGSQALLLSPGTTQETLPAGGSRIAITVYQWDPRNDLAAYLTHRKTAWTDSGSTIISEEAFELADGRQAVNFVLQGPDKAQSFILLTTVGEDYLQVSGEGNLALIEEIARTLQPLKF
jgi:hypothetical protein